MRITFTPNIYGTNNTRKENFKGLLHIDEKTGNPNDSWFFRDYKTLSSATSEIRENFPEGADIWDYACSNGEETISIKSFLPENQYKVKGFDISDDPLKLAKRGVYSLFSFWHDSFLMSGFEESYDKFIKDTGYFAPSIEERTGLRKIFLQIMEPAEYKSEYKYINNRYSAMLKKRINPRFREEYYRLKSEFKDGIAIEYGDINHIDELPKKRPVGGIFFRNGVYQLCDNNITEVMSGYGLNNLNINRGKVCEDLVDKIYRVLDENGIFVLGTHIKEHLFLANKSTPREDRMFLSETPFFNPNNKHHRYCSDLCCEQPLYKALLKDGRFEPIKYSFARIFKGDMFVKVPVVWKKVKI